MRIANLESIERELAKAATLARLLEERSAAFPGTVKSWLSAMEASLSSNQLPQAAEIAAIRTGLISVEHGVIPSGLTFRGRPTRSRILNAAAVSSMQRATELVAHVVRETRSRFAEAEALGMQIIALAKFKDLTPPEAVARDRALVTMGGDRQPLLRDLWQKLLATPELTNAAVRLEGLVGLADALVILDRSLRASGPPSS